LFQRNRSVLWLRASKKHCGKLVECQSNTAPIIGAAAVRHLDKSGQEDWTKRYDALMAHYGMQPTWNNTGVAHENGDVEQSHYRFKEAVDQALRIRGSREFPSRAAYDRGSRTSWFASAI